MYLVNAVRVDAIFATNRLARFMDNPADTHWDAVRHLLKYLQLHPHAHIRYTSNIPTDHYNKLIAYVDSNWAKDRDNCCSTTGWIVFLNGGPIAWHCGKQKSASGSSAESEYKAMYDLSIELMARRHFLTELGFPIQEPTVMFEDSTACIKYAGNPVQHSAMKSIDPKYHVVRHFIEQGQLCTDKIHTDDNIADMCTKALIHTKHSHFRACALVFPDAPSSFDDMPHKRARTTL
jgi:hypothetical protein